MVDFLLCSGNENKKREISLLMKKYIKFDYQLLNLNDVGTSDDVAEYGKSFRENALIKAEYAANLGYIGIGDDSGLEVDYLNGEPGIYSARFAGEEKNDQKNNEKLLNLLYGVPKKDRIANFSCFIACVIPKRYNISLDSFSVEGRCEGSILESGRGFDGFGYDPIFYINEYSQTFAEMSINDKNKISHRSKAVKAFAEIFNELIK